jgi:hypothetical protein
MNKLDRIKLRIKPILIKNNVSRLSIFGSFARGEEKKNSDIDMLVKFTGQKSLMDLMDLKFDLEKELKIDVDIATYDSINPLLEKIIKKDEIKIYG